MILDVYESPIHRLLYAVPFMSIVTVVAVLRKVVAKSTGRGPRLRLRLRP